MVILTTLLSSQNAHCANDDERRLSLWCLSSGILALINIHKSARFREFTYFWLSKWKHVIISESISPFQHKLLSAFPRVWRFTTTSSPENLFRSVFQVFIYRLKKFDETSETLQSHVSRDKKLMSENTRLNISDGTTKPFMLSLTISSSLGVLSSDLFVSVTSLYLFLFHPLKHAAVVCVIAVVMMMGLKSRGALDNLIFFISRDKFTVIA